jgi:hypothetical protein
MRKTFNLWYLPTILALSLALVLVGHLRRLVGRRR